MNTAIHSIFIPGLALLMVAGNALTTAQAQDPSDQPGDYGYAMTIHTTDTNSRWLFDLPKEVYLYSQTKNLSDLQVFNGKGEKIEFGLIPTEFYNPKTSEKRHAKIYPIWDNAPVRKSSEATPAFDPYGWKAPKGKVFSALIVELFDKQASPLFSHRLESLTLIPEKAPEGYQGTIEIFESAHLKSWQAVNIPTQTISWLQNHGSIIENNTLDAFSIRPGSRFLLIKWSNGSPPINIAKVEYTITTTTDHRQNYTLEINSNNEKKDSNEWLYEVPLAVIPHWINFILPQENTNLNLTLGYYRDFNFVKTPTVKSLIGARPPQDRAQPNQPSFEKAYEGRFFRLLKNGAEVRNDPVYLPMQANVWVVRPATDSRFANTDIPKLQLQWQADKYYVVTSGPPPYRLAFGRALPQTTRLAHPTTVVNHSNIRDYQVAQVSELIANPNADPKQIREQQQTVQKRYRWLFWLILICATALLGGFAWVLYKKSQTSPDSATPQKLSDAL